MKPVIKNILVPTDYSATALRAAKIAATIAKETEAELYVMHSYGLPVVGVAESIVIADDIKHTEGKKLNQFINDLHTEFGRIKIHGILEFGTAADWIQRKSEDHKIDLVVMGTKGDTDNANSIFGSVTSHVINNLKCPVLVVPKGIRSFNVREVLFATDFHFTDNAADYLKPFLALANHYEPFIHVAQFTANKPAGAHLKNIEELKLTGLLKDTKHSFHYVEGADTEKALFSFAEKYHCDLIVSVTRHYSLWEKIFHHSLTKELVLHSEIPVLVLHEY
ncbi:MAG: universal stress protein [Crocinitomicaceae bacterium]|nr:universal stress protein [Crocinitomicaceae bacterium]